jgi:hypothetical protein
MFVYRMEGEFACEKNRFFWSYAELGPNQFIVASKQQLKKLFFVVFGRGEEVGLVFQSSLSEREPDCGDVASLSFEADIPAARYFVIAEYLTQNR